VEFWDYDYGWVGSIHDGVLFQKIDVRNYVMKDKFLPYKLIGDATYQMWPWCYSPFKDEKDGLPRYKTHWNFIQSSIRKSMERTFGMLKDKFQILLKEVNIPSHHMPNLAMTCICLQNMHIVNSNGFDMD
jgi:hypothetical protein